MWKHAAVKNLHSSYPERFKDEAKYYDWKSAMKFLDNVYHKNRIDKNDKQGYIIVTQQGETYALFRRNTQDRREREA